MLFDCSCGDCQDFPQAPNPKCTKYLVEYYAKSPFISVCFIFINNWIRNFNKGNGMILLLNNSIVVSYVKSTPNAKGIRSFRTHGRFVPRRFVPRLGRFVPTFDRFVPNPLVDSYPTNYDTKQT